MGLIGGPSLLTDDEVVRWLRQNAHFAPSVPAPEMRARERSYTRTLVHRTDRFEIVVIHWTPGCESAIHDHGGSHCWFAVASGTMGIENFTRFDDGRTPGYARIGFGGRLSLGPGDVDFREDDVHLHRCVTAEEPAITLHLYANPIERYNTFDVQRERCADVTSTYDAILTV